jgi:hypothetical protein
MARWTFKFKKEFEKRLRGVKTRYFNNFLAENRGLTYEEFEAECKRLDGKPNFRDFLASSFSWRKSTEGFEFWYDIARK